MISDSEISVCLEHEVKSKIGTIFTTEKILEEKSVKNYKTDSYFYELYKEKIQTDKNDREYILFRIDIYFTEYFQQQKLMKRVILTETLLLKKKDKKRQKKNLTVNLLELILVGKIMIYSMKLVEYKYLLVNLKTKKMKTK